MIQTLIRSNFQTLNNGNIRDILAQRYQGSRYSFGYPACPNIKEKYNLKAF
jgi:5-methyltetrahydrofolate--homocysteine methyltransferase